MDIPDEGLLDVDILADDGSDDEGDAPPSSGPASTPTSCTSSPPQGVEEPASPHSGMVWGMPGASFFGTAVGNAASLFGRSFFGGRRGPGRPRKEGVKLVREGKIVKRPRGSGNAMRGAKRHRVSREDSLEDYLFDEDDFIMPAPDDPPYFPEKWQGRLCALCNLGERSQLGQGEMRQFACGSAELPSQLARELMSPPPDQQPGDEGNSNSNSSQIQQSTSNFSRRQKASCKYKTPLYNAEHTDELTIIGHTENLELATLVFSGFIYIHKSCLDFSPPFQDQVSSQAQIGCKAEAEVLEENAALSKEDDVEVSSLGEVRVRGIILAALQRKCASCSRYGASVPCKMSCSKYYHLPCVLASGGFQDFTTKSSFCKEHLYQAPLVCTADIDCRNCGVVGDLANLMTCVTCGAHYHGTCVGLPQLPGVRAGWSCRSCRVCQVCRVPETSAVGEGRAVSCEQCDKLYHASCLRPQMASVPKYGWKCKCCRVCSDCGSRSPGAGQSSRWHAHFTVCDSCYQQRNKGSSCPLCRRAYRAAHQREMVRCNSCKRCVHSTCDADADLQIHQLKKDQQPGYEYNCPICKPILGQMQSQTPTHMRRKDSVDDETMTSVSQDSSFGEDSILEQDPLAFDTKLDIGLGKGKPYSASSKIAKKKLGSFKFKGGFGAGKFGFQKRQRSGFLEFGRKRGTKSKMRGVFGVPGLGLQRPQAPDNKGSDEEPGVENKLVLCSSKDKFVLTQDVCVMCGAIGTDSEGCLIACAQCGQMYHPYCVNIKVSKVIVSLGWRCLDCTVCEGCGHRGDDARLVLCDDCDATYHTYCARPPLATVPRGSWKCDRCRRCLTCGVTAPGHNSHWMNGYTECGPCASLVMCCVCTEPYSDGELIIQCEACSRWLHAACDGIRDDNEADKCCQMGYNCLLCRPKEQPPPHLLPPSPVALPPTPPPPTPPPLPPPPIPPPPASQVARPPSPSRHPLLHYSMGGDFMVDDVCLSAHGMRQMKLLEADMMGSPGVKKKRRGFKNEVPEKDAVVQNAELDIAGDEIKQEPGDVKDDPVSAIYKEGMVWIVSSNGPVPEGFTIYTTESGVTVLRRKRQRNLQKLGIGGFVVRQRNLNAKQHEDEKAEQGQNADGTGTLSESPSSKRKPRRKPRSKLMEAFPSYMQEAFFGKDLLESPKMNPSQSPTSSSFQGPLTPTGMSAENSDSESDEILTTVTMVADNDVTTTIILNPEELDLIESVKTQEDRDRESQERTPREHLSLDKSLNPTKLECLGDEVGTGPGPAGTDHAPHNHGTDGGGRDMHDVSQQITLNLPKQENSSNDEAGPASSIASTISPKEDLSLMGVNLDTLPNMDSNDVEEIFKGVLTDDSQESQESAVSFVNSVGGSTSYNQQRQQLTSPMEYTSPYHTEYSGSSSQLSPAFSESGVGGGGSSWGVGMGAVVGMGVGAGAGAEVGASAPAPTQQPATTYNQRSADKMKLDESLGGAATISAVLYANLNHPEWKVEFPVWQERCRQILKKWRALPNDQKGPYLQKARDNRSAIRMKKAHQITSGGEPAAVTTAAPVVKEEPAAAAVEQCEVGTSSVAVVTVAVAVAVPPRARPSARYSGPAPNVTVTPGGAFAESGRRTGAAREADAHIRVLTPSEIMRTLPSLDAEQTAPEQERMSGQQRSAREAEQERQWKQLQQQRQLQTQHQQQIIHDQRIQDPRRDLNPQPATSSSWINATSAIARMQRQVSSDPNNPYPSEQLQVSVNEQSPLQAGIASPSPTMPRSPFPQGFPRPTNLGGPRTPRPGDQRLTVRSPFSPASPLDAYGASVSPARQTPEDYIHSPRSLGHQSPHSPARTPTGMPRPHLGQIYAPRPLDGNCVMGSMQEQMQSQPPLELNRQLRDLLQRHQPPNKLWTQQSVGSEEQQQLIGIPTSSMDEPQFRQPLPPGSRVRPPAPSASPSPAQSPSQSQHSPLQSQSPLQQQQSPLQQQQSPLQQQQSPLQQQQSPLQQHQSPLQQQSALQQLQQQSQQQSQQQQLQQQTQQQQLQQQQLQQQSQQQQLQQQSQQQQLQQQSQQQQLQQQQSSLQSPLQSQQQGLQLQPGQLMSMQQTVQGIQQQHIVRQQQAASLMMQQRMPMQQMAVAQSNNAAQQQGNMMQQLQQQQQAQQQMQQQILQQQQMQQQILQQQQQRKPGMPPSAIGQSPPIQGEKPQQQPPSSAATATPSPHTQHTPHTQASGANEDMADMDMDKLEQENIAEVGDLLGGLGGEDDEELLVSLTAEMGDDFNILEYADPELDAFTDADTSHILDGLELADDANGERHSKRETDEKEEDVKSAELKANSADMMKAVKNLENENTVQIKLEADIKQEIELEPQKRIQKPIENQNFYAGALPKLENQQQPANRDSTQQNVVQSQPLTFQQMFKSTMNSQQQQQQQQQQLQLQGQLQQQGTTQFLKQQGVVRQMEHLVAHNRQAQFSLQAAALNKQAGQLAQGQLPHNQLLQRAPQQQLDGGQPVQQAQQQQVQQVQQAQQFANAQQQIRPQFAAQHVQRQQSGAALAALQQQMQAQVSAALAGGRPMAPGTQLVAHDGTVGTVQRDHTVTVHYPTPILTNRMGVGVGLRGAVGRVVGGVMRRAPPPPPPYPGTPQRLAPPPPPPPYPSQVPLDNSDPWSDWMRRRPLLLQNVNQEQPLLLEDLLEQEKREQERQTEPEWSRPSSVAPPPPPPAPAAPPPPPSVPLFQAANLPAPPPPPERVLTEADRQAQMLYEQWLQQQNGVVTHQLKYYETEVQKLRKIRKSLNSKQRQLRKSGNELTPPDAAELRRVSAEQAALQKHLESARKQCRQHGTLIQEYRNKQQINSPQIAQPSALAQPQITHGQTNVFSQQMQTQTHLPINQVQQNQIDQVQTGQMASQLMQSNQLSQQNQLLAQNQHLVQQRPDGQAQSQQLIEQQIQHNLQSIQQQVHLNQQTHQSMQLNQQGRLIHSAQSNQQTQHSQMMSLNQHLTHQTQLNQQQNDNTIEPNSVQQQSLFHQQQGQMLQGSQQSQQSLQAQLNQHQTQHQTQTQMLINQQQQSIISQAQQRSSPVIHSTQNGKAHGNIVSPVRSVAPQMSPLHSHIPPQSPHGPQMLQSPHSNQAPIQSPHQQMAPQSPHQSQLPGQSPLHSMQSPHHHQNPNASPLHSQMPSQSPVQMPSQSPHMTVPQSPLMQQPPPSPHLQQGPGSGAGHSSHLGQAPSQSPHQGMSLAQSPHQGMSMAQSPHQGISLAQSPHQGISLAQSPHQGMSMAQSPHQGMSSAQSPHQGMSLSQSPQQQVSQQQHQQYLQQLQGQRTSPQMPAPSQSPQMMYQQSQINSPASSQSLQMQGGQSQLGGGVPQGSQGEGSIPGVGGRSPFPRPPSVCSPLPTRFARPPMHHNLHQQGMRVGVTFGGRQSSPLGSPQPLMSPGNNPSDNMMLQRQQLLQRQQYSPMGGPPSSPLSRSPHVTRTPTPSASPAASPASDPHGGGGGGHNVPAPLPPELKRYRYFKLGLMGGSPMWQGKGIGKATGGEGSCHSSGGADQGEKLHKHPHANQVTILKKKAPPKVSLPTGASISSSKVTAHYAELDDSSNTPPTSPNSHTPQPPARTPLSKPISIKSLPGKKLPQTEESQHSDEDVVLIESSPDEKHEIMDYDDENLVGTEVSLCAAAADSDQGEMSGMEPYTSDMGDIAASPLDTQDYVLFSDGVDYAVDSDDSIKFIHKEEAAYNRRASDSNSEGTNNAVTSPNEYKRQNIQHEANKTASHPSHRLDPNDMDAEEMEEDNEDDDDDDDIEEHLDDDEIVVVDPHAVSPGENIATELDFEEMIDSGKPEDNTDEEEQSMTKNTEIPIVVTSVPPTTGTAATKKTVAVINLTSKQPQTSGVHQFKILNTGQTSSSLTRLPVLNATVLSPHANNKILNEVSQATVASVSIANQTISVPVLKSLNVPISVMSSGHLANSQNAQLKKVPLSITTSSLNIPLSKPLTSVISVISSNVNVPRVATLSPVITLATSNTVGTARMPISILTQQQVKQKVVKTIEKQTSLSLSSTKLSTLTVSQDMTLPAKIFEDEAASPDSTVGADDVNMNQSSSSSNHSSATVKDNDQQTQLPTNTNHHINRTEIDIETQISKQTELPQTLASADNGAAPMFIAKPSIKSPDRIPETIPDNIMEGDEEERTEDSEKNNSSKVTASTPATSPNENSSSPRLDMGVLKTIKAIANKTNDMLLDSNMQLSSDVSQESVQISIPSPTPSQEQYLDHITMQQQNDAGTENTKKLESLDDMLDMLISDEAKPTERAPEEQQLYRNDGNEEARLGLQEANSKLSEEHATNTQEIHQSAISSSSARTSLLQPSLPKPSHPGQSEVASSISQQLRSIISTFTTARAESTISQSQVLKKAESSVLSPVNFENLLPSSKVEVVNSSRGSPISRTIEKSVTSVITPDNSHIGVSAAMVLGTRVNTLSGKIYNRLSPLSSPISSPVQMPCPSPNQSPAPPGLVMSPLVNDEIPIAVSQQAIQMPALSKIQGGVIQNSNSVQSAGNIQMSQIISSNLLNTTLLQTSRQMGTSNIQFPPQSISASQPPALIMSSRPSPQDNSNNSNIRNVLFGQTQNSSPKPAPLNIMTSSTLLHTQLTSPLKRSKSTDEAKSEAIVGHIQPTKRYSMESVIVKTEPMETDDIPVSNSHVDNQMSCLNKTFPGLGAPQKAEDSQNVLLKQLLQNSTNTVGIPTRPLNIIQRSAPSLGLVPSLEAQLARPSIPPPSLPTSVMTQEIETSRSSPHRQMMVREPLFVSRTMPTSVPMSTISQASITVQSSTHSLMDVRRPLSKPVVREETSPVPASSPSLNKQLELTTVAENQSLPVKEVIPPQQSPVIGPFTPIDVKKELLDESSQQSAASGVSAASDQGKCDIPIKEEDDTGIGAETGSDSVVQETPLEAKKRKRREYQQKRRLMQNSLKSTEPPVVIPNTSSKKRPRKGSKLEEDYDTFIDNLMVQLRQLPPMQIQEPTLCTNFAVCPLFGSGDQTKFKSKDYDILRGDLIGDFGDCRIPNVSDYYNTKPFGDEEPLPEKSPTSTQRGFYDQEFPPIRFEDESEDKKIEMLCKERDVDTPDSIVSCSSPECYDIEGPHRFPGLKLDDEDEDEDDFIGRASPAIPIIAPVPIRVKPLSLYQLKEEGENKIVKKMDAELSLKTKMIDSPGSSEGGENVTVTLTLTSDAAEDILGVLRELAGILHIPPPTAYQIVERTSTPPSHRLGLYRTKGKDGKEGTPIDIQSILNGAAKFCRHCDVVILDCVIRAKASEFPLLSSQKIFNASEDLLTNSDTELYFCSTQCYERFSWRPTNILIDSKAIDGAIDEKSQTTDALPKEKEEIENISSENMETEDSDLKPDIKEEKMDLSFMDCIDNDVLMKEVVDDVAALPLDDEMRSDSEPDISYPKIMKQEDIGPLLKQYQGVNYKGWAPGCIVPSSRYKRPTDRELTELVFRTGVAVMPCKSMEDMRKCALCGIQGDGVADGVSRLLNYDVDRWVHLNCALWSDGVYETGNGALVNVETALSAGVGSCCAVCQRTGATVKCFKTRCGNAYHLGCAVKDSCVFHKNKTAFCASHAPKGEKDNELTTLSVQRRVFVNRDEHRQVAAVMQHTDMDYLIRVGSLIFLNVGHLLPHQLAAFHTPNYIYPVGYKIVRFYWSMRRFNSRCRYICSIVDAGGRPEFCVQVQEARGEGAEGELEMRAPTARAAWAKVLDSVGGLREGGAPGALKLWSHFVTGEDLFGLSEPAVVRVLESLPGIETLSDYRFKFGRSPLLEAPLALNPSGAARTEARGKAGQHWRRPHGQRAALAPPTHNAQGAPPSAEPACPYSKQFVHSKSSQYKKMTSEWRNNVYLARSKIQGLGLYAARDIEKHTMVIEYIGEVIRHELSEIREKQYEAKNRGIYMFRLDERRVIDATLCGGLARYINHSCAPNCVAEAVEVDRHLRIIIFAKRRIARGEELAYDYKFDIEDDAHKIQCMCGAPNCRKWMN